ncbi:pyridine nucleotide-disulfide oxidoreductase [Actinomadura craniellae]|uniref:Pyridine nucleotide-disulfide oxidoreductase n=1 Tax=Actinomadura craniellae TaxID=2231787 RepID=A0A365GWG8_9ACTN|nr:NAD(P)/FAD-dependent oxidoreductase [Actinomadura craniellae]RAY11144.1 pyridine nucleotide-disulfide oxidoreductase [Actinomadura craniellae]
MSQQHTSPHPGGGAEADVDVDVVVIGGGPAGEIAVARAVRGGLTAALVESRLAGGECAYYACVPSKALLRPMESVDEARRVRGVAAALTGSVDVPAVLARRDETIYHLDDSKQVAWVESLPAVMVRGFGRLRGPRLVEAVRPDGTGTELRARHAVILATGTEPALPSIPGLAEANPWTNREATTFTKAPRRLAVIGAGPVACEMAQALHFLGAEETTILVRGHRLLARTEPFAGELLLEEMRRKGIDVRFGRQPVRVDRADADGPVTLHLDDGGTLEVDELLVATGRRSAVDGLGLDTVGLEPTGPLRVGPDMRVEGVAGDWLYAVGDVNGLDLLTHMGKYQARLCGDVIAARAAGRPDDLPGLREIADGLGAPQVVFTDPQVCCVGRTEEAARAEGFDVRVVEYDLAQVTGAYLQADGYRGRAKAVVDERRRVLLGVTFVGPGVADLLHSATIAVVGEVPMERLWHAVPVFPAVSEIWLHLLEEYGL